MLTLRGVALVVEDQRKGPKLAFSYPIPVAIGEGEGGDNFARLFRPRRGLSNQHLLLHVDGATFVSYPTLLPSYEASPTPATPASADELGFDEDDADANSRRPLAGDSLNMFNVVFMLYSEGDGAAFQSRLPVAAARRAMLSGIKDVAQRVAACLLYLEGRSGYVSEQAHGMLNAKPDSSQRSTPQSDFELLSGLTRREGLGLGDMLAPVPGIPCFSLARELAFVYLSLSGGLGSTCHLTFGGWVSVSLSLSIRSPLVARTDEISTIEGRPLVPGRAQLARAADKSAAAAAASSNTPTVATTSTAYLDRTLITRQQLDSSPIEMMPIRPYHTLFLLQRREDVLAMLPLDCSPQLGHLVRAANPQRSFHELQNDTGVPSAQLLRLAGHLVHYGLADIADTITKRSVYAVAPSANLDPRSPLALEFSSLFGVGGGGHTHPSAHTSVTTGNSGDALGEGSDATSLAAVLSMFSHAPVFRPEEDEGSAMNLSGSAGGERVDVDSHSPASPSVGSPGASPLPERQQQQQQPRRPALVTGRGLPVKDIIRDATPVQEQRFVAMLAWLLKHGFIKEVHAYIYLSWPWMMHDHDRRERRAGTGSRGRGFVEAAEGSELSPPARDTEVEVAYRLAHVRGTDASLRSSPPTAAAATASMKAASSSSMRSSSDGYLPNWKEPELQHLAALSRGHPPHVVDLLYRLVSYLWEATIPLIPLRSERASTTFSSTQRGGRLRDENVYAEDDADADYNDDGDTYGDDDYVDAVGGFSSAQLLSLRIEEIMYRLFVSREALVAVVRSFPGLLVKTSHISA